MSRPALETLPQAPGGQKADLIMKAAKTIFTEQGYGAASMDAIARAAGVSKVTIYSYFDNKERLFAAIIASECQACIDRMAPPDVKQLPLKEGLQRVGRTFLTFLLSPKTLSVFRTVIAEVSRFPELGRVFYECGPCISREGLAAYLEHAAARGEIELADSALAAKQFLGLIKSDVHIKSLLGLTPPSSEELDRVVEQAVEFFLRAYAPDHLSET